MPKKDLMIPETNLQALDIDFVRLQFPFFETELSQEWSFFQNAGGSLPCGTVVDRLTRFYRENKVQPATHNALAAAASEQMNAGRSAMAALLGVPESTITLGASTTQNINTLGIACSAFLEPGDEILVSEQDHEANIGGWERVARSTGAVMRMWPVNPETGELEKATFEKLLNPKTKIVSLTHSSNIVGSINPIREIAQKAHEIGARVVIDGVSYAPHAWPDILATGADAYGFSTYKTFGTHQGVLYVDPDFMEELAPQCHFYKVGKTWTHLDSAGADHASIAALAGLGDYFETMYDHHFNTAQQNRREVSTLSLHQKARSVSLLMQQHEQELCTMLLDALGQLPVRIIGKPTMEGRKANVSILVNAIPSSELSALLAGEGIVVSNGHFDAYRLLRSMDIDPHDGVVRISFAHYNTRQETMNLIAALKKVL